MAGRTRAITAASAEDLGAAAAACDFPLVVWELPGAVVRIVNPAAEELIGLAAEHLIGRSAGELVTPPGIADSTVAALASGALSATLSERDFIGRLGRPVHVWMWTRGVDISDGRRGAVSLLMPEDQVARLGADPGRPWRSLAEVVIGMTDTSWTIQRISADVSRVLGARSKDLVGMSFRDLVHPDDADGIGKVGGDDPCLPMRGRLRRPDGTWAEVGMLFSPFVVEGERHICFALIGHPAADLQVGRVANVEQQLRRIADELRAAHAMNVVEMLPPMPANLPLGELSSRQWEILSRLIRGQRVATIARELYLSPTTVRNHLSAIFQRFGVHSQRELLDLLQNR